MTRRFRYTLLTDGSSDRALGYPIAWLLRNLRWHEGQASWADLRARAATTLRLVDRIVEACKNYPCDVLFVHRDAEPATLQNRVQEIQQAIASSGLSVPHVSVVPVRMLEAWLLHDEAAIRRAAGNPNGTQSLNLPPLSKVEQTADPKQVLRQALLDAVAPGGRRRNRAQRDFGKKRHRVAELITDYSPLRNLSAFAAFERDLKSRLAAL